MKEDNNFPELNHEKGNKDNFPGYPEYSSDDDIFFKGKEAEDLDPEMILGKEKKPGYSKLYTDDLWNDEMEDGHDIHESEFEEDMGFIGRDDDDSNYFGLKDDNIDDMEDLIE